MKKRTIWLAILVGFILALFMIDCEGDDKKSSTKDSAQIRSGVIILTVDSPQQIKEA